MNALEHQIAWIESSRPHYDRLLELERARKVAGCTSNAELAREAFSIAVSAYSEAVRGGDMYASEQSPRTILDAACALLEWELEA